MRKRYGIKTVFFLYGAFALLLAGILFGAALYSTHLLTISLPDGKEVSSDWPRQYAENLKEQIQYENGGPLIDEAALPYLQKNNIWVQFLDNGGHQVSAYALPPEIPSSYTFEALFKLAEYNQLEGYTAVFIPVDRESCMGYIVGFPVAVTKTLLYWNADRYIGGRDLLHIVLAATCGFLLLAGLLYSIWLTRHVSRIASGASTIASRTYSPLRRKGAFGDAYHSLDGLYAEITASDLAHAETDRMREEWIVNITHDLKTPLSPIKGYAELLCDGSYSPSDIPKYGRIIAKSAATTERLINDLKLTYQMDSGAVPVHLQPVNLVREIRELIIDLLNDTNYVNRTVQFTCDKERMDTSVDMPLFKRAVTNIIVNALTHNPPETTVSVSLHADDVIVLSVSDDGRGLTQEEIRRLFTRYYRGAGTDERPEGSGLGLAIAKQIVELHHGAIEVQSEPGLGTTILLRLPNTNGKT